MQHLSLWLELLHDPLLTPNMFTARIFSTTSESHQNGHAVRSCSQKPCGVMDFHVQESHGTTGLAKATVGSCGSKAAFCAKLAKLSKTGDFNTPSGFCLPFGNMEHALKVIFITMLLRLMTPSQNFGCLYSTCAVSDRTNSLTYQKAGTLCFLSQNARWSATHAAVNCFARNLKKKRKSMFTYTTYCVEHFTQHSS